MAYNKAADISKWQGLVDFSRVRNEVDFLILRTQHGSSTPDTKYNEYVAGCKANNIKFSSYAYAQYVSISDAQVEATDFYNRSDKSSITYVVDVEEVTTNNASDLVPATQKFIDTLHNLGIKKVGLYSGQSFYHDHNLDQVKADFLWIARYGTNNGSPQTPPDIACDLWQYTSVGSIDGISGNVDLNQLNGDKPLSYFTTNTIESIPNTPPPIPVVMPTYTKMIVIAECKMYNGSGIHYDSILTINKNSIVYLKSNSSINGYGYFKFINSKNITYYGYIDLRSVKTQDQIDADKLESQKKLYYIVGSGDGLGYIAKTKGVTVAQLKQLNGLKDKCKITVGQSIRYK